MCKALRLRWGCCIDGGERTRGRFSRSLSLRRVGGPSVSHLAPTPRRQPPLNHGRKMTILQTTGFLLILILFAATGQEETAASSASVSTAIRHGRSRPRLSRSSGLKTANLIATTLSTTTPTSTTSHTDEPPEWFLSDRGSNSVSAALNSSEDTSGPAPADVEDDIVTRFLRIVESQHLLGANCTAGTDLNLGEGVVDRLVVENS